MYEESQQANTRLKDDLEKVRHELVSSKKKFEEALKVKFSMLIIVPIFALIHKSSLKILANIIKQKLCLQVANSGGLTETEKKEKKALEKKLCEMEEELKVSLFLKLEKFPIVKFSTPSHQNPPICIHSYNPDLIK